MKLTINVWDTGFSDYLFTEAKLSAENQGDIYLKSRYKLICSFFLDKDFNKLNFNAFVRSMQERKCSAAYMNNIIKLAKHLNNYLKEYFHYDAGIEKFTYFERERKIYDIFTLEEVKRIFSLDYPYEREANYKNQKFKTIFRVLAETGIRRLELRKLTWDDVLSDHSIRIGVKNKTERLVPISEELYKQIFSLPRKSEFVFPGERTGGMIDQTIIGDDLALRKKHLNIVGKDKTVHKYRHFFATDLLQNGAQLKHIQWLLGHKSIQSTETYLHYITDELRETVMAFSSLQVKNDKSIFSAFGNQVINFIRKLSRNRFNISIKEDPKNKKIVIIISEYKN